MARLEAIQIVSISELTLLFTLSNSDLKWLRYDQIAILSYNLYLKWFKNFVASHSNSERLAGG